MNLGEMFGGKKKEVAAEGAMDNVIRPKQFVVDPVTGVVNKMDPKEQREFNAEQHDRDVAA